MTRIRSWRLAAVTGLAGATVLASGAALFAFTSAGGMRLGTLPLGFSHGYEQRAFRALSASSAPATLSKAAEDARRALALSPYDNAARLRLAYIDALQNRRLGPAGMAQLSRSYDLVPLDYTVAAWRVRFALEHWDALSPKVRADVHREAGAFTDMVSHDADVRGVLQSDIANPSGRLAAALWWREFTR